ncbi:MAG: AraC family transcriptional regulator [Polyangiaceae bacterium]|nr:AraC family transcriptional regulator [Polyangiaceae bacterium]
MADSPARSDPPGPVWAQRFTGHALAPSPCPPVVHDFMALGFLTGGSAVMQQRVRYHLQPGDVFLVPAGERHGTVAAQAPEAWGISFRPACYTPGELGALLDPFERAVSGASTVVPIPASRQEHLAGLCAELHRETKHASPHAHAELARKSLLALILTEIARASSVTATAGLQPTLVGDALRFIERNCLLPISLREVAAAVNRSPSYVATTVKAATGKTVVEWILAGRIAEARNRLLHTDERVDIIAERVGYADPTHFIRLFRRTHGATPAAWRARQRALRATS